MGKLLVLEASLVLSGCVVIPFGAAVPIAGRSQSSSGTNVTVNTQATYYGIRHGVQVNVSSELSGAPEYRYVYYLENTGKERVRIDWDADGPLPANSSGVELGPGERQEFNIPHDSDQSAKLSNIRVTVLDGKQDK